MSHKPQLPEPIKRHVFQDILYRFSPQSRLSCSFSRSASSRCIEEAKEAVRNGTALNEIPEALRTAEVYRAAVLRDRNFDILDGLPEALRDQVVLDIGLVQHPGWLSHKSCGFSG